MRERGDNTGADRHGTDNGDGVDVNENNDPHPESHVVIEGGHESNDYDDSKETTVPRRASGDMDTSAVDGADSDGIVAFRRRAPRINTSTGIGGTKRAN